jgi:predicted GIY-YIG superfamily endonuclease
MSYESCTYCNGNLYAGIAKDVKNQQLFTNLYLGITMNVKKLAIIYETYM